MHLPPPTFPVHRVIQVLDIRIFQLLIVRLGHQRFVKTYTNDLNNGFAIFKSNGVFLFSSAIHLLTIGQKGVYSN